MTEATSNPSGVESKKDSSSPQNDAAAPKSASPLSGPLGLIVAIVLLATAGYLSYKAFTTSEPVPLDSPSYTFICAETLKTFPHQPKKGETHPIESPYTKKRTGYPAEACYWGDKDKKTRRKAPVYVLLNKYIGKSEPTICPVCGAIVLPHNERPGPDVPYVDATATTEKNTPTTQPAGPDD